MPDDDKPAAARPSILDNFGLDQAAHGERFDGEDLFKAELIGLRFEDCEFHGCNFENSLIKGCTFTRSRFVRCTFSEARLEESKFAAAAEGSGCVWSFCTLTDARFAGCNLSLNKFDRGLLHNATFEKCAAMGLAFEAEVHRRIRDKLITGGVHFTDCRLQYAVFQSRDLSHSAFAGCDLRDASFRRSNLSDCNLGGSALSNTDFSGATLDRATIAHAGFDDLKLADMMSHAGLMVSQDQAAALLRGLGIIVVR